MAPYTGFLSLVPFQVGTMSFSLPLIGVGAAIMLLSVAGCEIVPGINNRIVDQFESKRYELTSLVSQRQSMIKEKLGLEKELVTLRQSAHEIKDMGDGLNAGNSADIFDNDDFVSIRGIRLEKVKRLTER